MSRPEPPDFERLSDEALEAKQRDECGPLIEAAYGGSCRGCGMRWEPGDFICWSDGESAWICADCSQQ